MERKVYHQFWNDVAHIRTKAREVGNQRAYVSKEEKMKLSVKTFVQLFILGTSLVHQWAAGWQTGLITRKFL